MRFGVVGCGTVAQIMHVPYLAELPSAELYALSDVAPERARTLAGRHGVPNTFESAEALLDGAGEALDAVVVCTPPQTHAEVATATIEARLHTLVEKPLAMSPEEADRLVDAAEDADVTTMVAYNRRYDPAYERTAEALSDLAEVDLVTALDVDPDHGRIIEEVYDLVRAAVPENVVAETNRKRERDVQSAVGTDDERLVDAYDFQLEHVCHTVNGLRGLFGDVETVDHVDVFADGRYMTASLTYEGGIRCVLESGDADRKWFENSIRVDAPDGRLVLEYGNPFVKNSPAELRITRGTEELEDTTVLPSYDESFKRELRQFVRCIGGDAPVRTTFAEARDDVRLVAQLFREYRGAR